ncbi:MAG: tyrosine-type recombinase/integrase [Roseibacillus sp.]
MARPKQVTRFTISRFTNGSGSVSWKVAGTMPDGTRVRKNFPTKAEALQQQSDLELEADGFAEQRPTQRTSLTVEQLADAEAAFQQIGLRSLSTIVSRYLALDSRAKEKGATFDDAAAFFEARFRPETEVITILNATDKFLKSRHEIEEATERNYRSTFKLLLIPDPNRSVHEFTVSDLEERISRYKNLNTRKSHRRIFNVFFRWAQRHHYCLENPCDRLDQLPKEKRQIAILSLDEVQRLLTAAMEFQGGVSVAPIAIALFAGLRPSELADLSPSDLSSKRIRVGGGKLRRTTNRSTPIPDVLTKWLKEFPFEGIPKGWAYKMTKLKTLTQAKNWVPDVLRHTSVSYQAERDKDEALTAFNCGTSVQMMDQHYRDVIDEESAVDDFWNLTPAEVRTAAIAVSIPHVKTVKWPTKAQLQKQVWRQPLIKLAEELDVSNAGLKKRCEKLGLKLPPRGYWLRK